jgi:glycosyltransferase involved in cell wall biosynthesis
MLAYTIIAGNYSALAQVLATSFRRHHPSARFAAVIIDRPSESLAELAAVAEIVRIDEIDFGSEGYGPMAIAYNVTEFATAVKPWAAKHFLSQGEDVVFYIDPDILILTELTSLIQGVRDHAIALTPHCLAPMLRDGRMLREADILMSGVYNLGFIGVGPGAESFLEWWCDRLRRDAIIDPVNMLFTDQRWIDLAVPIFDPYIERSPRYNVAYWNVDQRPIHLNGGEYMIGDEPLGFYHFSGFDPRVPHLLSKYQGAKPRTLLSEHPTLSALVLEYAVLLHEAGFLAKSRDPYSWSKIAPDILLTDSLRRHYRDCLIRADKGLDPYPPDPTRADQYLDFVRWLNDPIPAETSGMPRYFALILEGRPDVRAAFPETMHGDTDRFCRWLWASGIETGSLTSVVPLPLPSPRNPAGALDEVTLTHSVRVAGYLAAESGVGEAGRLAVQALTAARVSAGVHSYARCPSRLQASLAVPASPAADADVNLVCVNADMLPSFAREMGPNYFRGRYTVGQWFWELDQFPERFAPSFDFVDEVWAATEHMRLGMAARTGKPVLRMPLPLLPPEVDPALSRESFGLSPARFVFLFNFDFLSIINRKNPTGLIDAFCSAFAHGEGPILLIKSINGAENLVELERLRYHRGNRSDVLIWDGYLDRSAQGALMASCDAYVSLHRAEGLGLTMSEAMSLGKPVIATGYSGNMDFMDESTAFLVPWSPVRVGAGNVPYQHDAVWADPDLGAAAELMRAVYQSPGDAAIVGEAGRQKLRAEFSPEACGARMRARLETIWRNQ